MTIISLTTQNATKNKHVIILKNAFCSQVSLLHQNLLWTYDYDKAEADRVFTVLLPLCPLLLLIFDSGSYLHRIKFLKLTFKSQHVAYYSTPKCFDLFVTDPLL